VTPRLAQLIAEAAGLAAQSAAVAGEIAKELAREPNAKPDEVIYGSRAPFPPPPGKSHRWVRENGPRLLEFGAERRGGARGRGVCWCISAVNYERFLVATRTPITVAALQVVDPTSWIAAAGHRPTRKAG
jgi:hypothetical protein